jgi:hypothetical protein
MKSLVVYYSSSGNTAQAAYKFLNALTREGETDIFELNYSGQARGLFAQLLDRLMPFRISLGDAPLDLKGYDVLCLGIPVWAGRPAPLVTRYLEGSKITGKIKVVCFLVYGVEASARRCLAYVRSVFRRKGHPEIIGVTIPWAKASDTEFMENLIQEAIAKLKA